MIVTAAALISASLLGSAPSAADGGWRPPVLLIAANEAQPRTAAEFLARGIERSNARDWDNAIADFGAAIALDPTNSETLRRRGNLRHVQRDHVGAMADLDRAVEVNPQDSVAYYLRALVWISEKDRGRAIEDFNRAIEINPRFSDAYVQRGQLYGYAGQPDAAMKNYTQAIAINPKHRYARIKRAETHIRKGFTRENIDLAIRDLQSVVEVNPSDTGTRQMLDRFMQVRQKLP